MHSETAPEPGRPEQVDRNERRRKVMLPGHALLEDGSTFEIMVVDLSYDGARIESAVGLLAGTPLKLSVLRLGVLEAHVRWCRNGFAGLCFRPVASKQHKPRRYERMQLTATMCLRRPGRRQYRARLFDVTPAGCRTEFVERPREGEIIWTKFDGLEALEGVVRWVDGFYGGIEFNRAIHPAVFEFLLARLQSAQERIVPAGTP